MANDFKLRAADLGSHKAARDVFVSLARHNLSRTLEARREIAKYWGEHMTEVVTIPGGGRTLIAETDVNVAAKVIAAEIFDSRRQHGEKPGHVVLRVRRAYAMDYKDPYGVFYEEDWEQVLVEE